MNITPSERATELHEQVRAFMDAHIYPNEEAIPCEEPDKRWTIPPFLEELKAKAKAKGLWNLFTPPKLHPQGLSNVDYAPIAETMGRVLWASEVFNCSAPDTGNMEVLLHFGSESQKERWLKPLLDGEIRSGFAMTEPAVASSDAANISTRIERDGDSYVINGRKWWTSGACDPRCTVFIVMGKTDPDAPRHAQQSMILVPKETEGVKVVRNTSVFGYDHAPHGHGEVVFANVRVPAENMILGEGRGFEIAQGRLGPGRIHHAMRAVGIAERALELTCKRASDREAFGKPLAKNDVVIQNIAIARMKIEQARLLTMKAAYLIDTVGVRAARKEVALIKVAAIQAANDVLDYAIQVHGGMGVCQDTFLAHAYALYRALKLGDGPDEVHLTTVGKLELSEYTRAQSRQRA
jgi:acyl-CoA dehydrogenase